MNTSNYTSIAQTASNQTFTAQNLSTEQQKSHTRSALDSTYELEIEKGIAIIEKRFGTCVDIIDEHASEKGVDIFFFDGAHKLREYWKANGAKRHEFVLHK